MTYAEIYSMISSIGLSCSYYQFPEGNAPALPYIVFYYPNNNDFVADNINYQTIVKLNIELYTENKDFTTEAAVETVLQNYGVVYQKTETYIDSELMYQILYESEVVITNG